MVDVLYSLVDVNERFDRLVIDPLYIRHLDMTIKSSFDRICSVDNKVLSRICEKILPRIYDQVNKLIVEPHAMKQVFTINYPQLYSLSLIGFQEEELFQYLTDDSVLRYLLTEQITDLNIDIQVDTIIDFSQSLSNKFELILSLSKRLISLNFCQLFGYRTLPLWFPTPPSKSCMSLTLTKLIIRVTIFRDCLYLLDGRFDCLSTLIIHVENISLTPSCEYNTEKLPKLKYFSLISYTDTFYYDQLIIPLLRRMINLEELILYLLVIRYDSTYIDGIVLYDEILCYMPQLNKLTFNINTDVRNNNIRIDRSSNEDVQRSFIGRGYGQSSTCI
ncbi:unnamed protein product [Rotaria sordida]|uniref:Uncharacterized protein n=1 Tax=Rotaria sordida TaxID=392033 RepID=A0A814U478_9BILA|nr:unnamed protein product [Rotaria sordida]CAF1422261.1 unnamed protein product [Rotaria sordida]